MVPPLCRRPERLQTRRISVASSCNRRTESRLRSSARGNCGMEEPTGPTGELPCDHGPDGVAPQPTQVPRLWGLGLGRGRTRVSRRVPALYGRVPRRRGDAAARRGAPPLAAAPLAGQPAQRRRAGPAARRLALRATSLDLRAVGRRAQTRSGGALTPPRREPHRSRRSPCASPAGYWAGDVARERGGGAAAPRQLDATPGPCPAPRGPRRARADPTRSPRPARRGAPRRPPRVN